MGYSFIKPCQKFQRELQTWWKLRHPNILPLLGYIHEDDVNEIYQALVSPVSSSIGPVSLSDSVQWMENGHAADYIRRDLSVSQRLNLVCHKINIQPKLFTTRDSLET
jgi:hypothetical protein